MTLEKVKRHLEELNPTLASQVEGCSPKEIQAIEERFDLVLPQVCRDWMAWMGKGPTGTTKGSLCFWPAWIGVLTYHDGSPVDLHAEGRELLEENDLDPALLDNCFVFFGHQGYQVEWIRCDEGDDPIVHRYIEGDGFFELGPLSDRLMNLMGFNCTPSTKPIQN